MELRDLKPMGICKVCGKEVWEGFQSGMHGKVWHKKCESTKKHKRRKEAN